MNGHYNVPNKMLVGTETISRLSDAMLALYHLKLHLIKIVYSSGRVHSFFFQIIFKKIYIVKIILVSGIKIPFLRLLNLKMRNEKGLFRS